MLDIIVAIFQLLIAVGFLGFWVYFFLVENKDTSKRAGYFEFERSFPLADLGWALPCLLIAAISLLIGQKQIGVFFSILAGSALTFLGLLDISHNLQYEGYKGEKMDVILNLVVNLTCIIFGPIFIVYGWFNFTV